MRKAKQTIIPSLSWVRTEWFSQDLCGLHHPGVRKEHYTKLLWDISLDFYVTQKVVWLLLDQRGQRRAQRTQFIRKTKHHAWNSSTSPKHRPATVTGDSAWTPSLTAASREQRDSDYKACISLYIREACTSFTCSLSTDEETEAQREVLPAKSHTGAVAELAFQSRPRVPEGSWFFAPPASYEDTVTLSSLCVCLGLVPDRSITKRRIKEKVKLATFDRKQKRCISYS